jgi:uncharacterized repeat protein (TIGR03847 family)
VHAKEREEMTDRYELAHPDRVTVGTVGPVGERMFLLQVREGNRTLTLKLEKAQVGALARYLGKMLRTLARPHDLPPAAELELEPFEEPDFVVRALAVTYDDTSDRIVLVADEIDRSAGHEEDSPEELFELEPEGASARFALTREQAAALAIRGTELVEAGRPPCPLCGYPLDPRGHACPRTNGNQAPLT